MEDADSATISIGPQGKALEAQLEVVCHSAKEAEVIAAQFKRVTEVLRQLLEKEKQKATSADLAGVLPPAFSSSRTRAWWAAGRSSAPSWIRCRANRKHPLNVARALVPAVSRLVSTLFRACYTVSKARNVETSLDAADTSVRATGQSNPLLDLLIVLVQVLLHPRQRRGASKIRFFISPRILLQIVQLVHALQRRCSGCISSCSLRTACQLGTRSALRLLEVLGQERRPPVLHASRP